MKRESRTRLRFNIIFIVLYLLFLIFFSFLRKSFNIKSNIETVNIGTASAVIDVADRSTNFIFSVFKNLGNYFRYKKSLISEIDNLRSELVLEKDKNILREEEITLGTTIISRKIFSDFTHIYDSILLDKGINDGIRSGNLVFIYPDRVVGKISDIGNSSAILTLFSKDKNKTEGVVKVVKTYDKVVDTVPLDNSTSTSASSTNVIESHVEIIKDRPSSIVIDIYGYGGGDFIAKIPENLEVATGTIIYLAEDESLAIGEVVKAEKEDASFYQILLIRGYYNTRENNTYYIKK